MLYQVSQIKKILSNKKVIIPHSLPNIIVKITIIQSQLESIVSPCYLKEGKLSKKITKLSFFHSFFMKTRDGKMKAVRELTPFFILLKEGGYIEINTNSTNPPEAITAKIELVNPTY